MQPAESAGPDQPKWLGFTGAKRVQAECKALQKAKEALPFLKVSLEPVLQQVLGGVLPGDCSEDSLLSLSLHCNLLAKYVRVTACLAASGGNLCRQQRQHLAAATAQL